MVYIVLAGFAGPMGKSVFQMAKLGAEVRVVSNVESENHPEIFLPINDMIGL